MNRAVEAAAKEIDPDAFGLSEQEFIHHYGGAPNWSLTTQANRQKIAKGQARAALLAALPHLTEQLEQVALAHVPVLGMTGRVVGCRCMDRVFVQHQETWAEHIAAAVTAHLERQVKG